MIPPDDELLAHLRALPERPPGPAVAERTHRIARAAFQRRAAAAAGDRFIALLGRLYWRAEPALALGVTVAYLAWAVDVLRGLGG